MSINEEDDFWKDALNDNENNSINKSKETSRNKRIKKIKLFNNKYFTSLKTFNNNTNKFFSLKNYNNNIKKKNKNTNSNNNKYNSFTKRNIKYNENNSNVKKFKSQNNLTTTELKEKESLLECTFKPKLNLITNKQLKQKLKIYSNKSIYDRNLEYSKTIKDNLLTKECNEQFKFYEDYKFKPKINMNKIIINKKIIEKLKNDRNINLYYFRMNSAREIKAMNENENITDRDSMYFNNDANYIINNKNKNRSISQENTKKCINFLHNLLMDIKLDKENISFDCDNNNKNKEFENITEEFNEDNNNKINGFYYDDKNN